MIALVFYIDFHNFIFTIIRILQKFTLTGSPDGNKCKQHWDVFHMTHFHTTECFPMDGYNLKVYSTHSRTGFYRNYEPMDDLVGNVPRIVIRNVAFTNTATGTTIRSPCTVPTEPKAVFFPSSRWISNKSLVLGLNGGSLSHFQNYIFRIHIKILNGIFGFENSNLLCACLVNEAIQFLGIKYSMIFNFESFDNSMKLRGMTLMLFMDTHSTYG